MSAQPTTLTAQKNCQSFKREFEAKDLGKSPLIKLDPPLLCKLLDGSIKAQATNKAHLLSVMQRNHWKLVAKLEHRPRPSHPKQPTPYLHLVVAAESHKYHVMCVESADGKIHIDRISP